MWERKKESISSCFFRIFVVDIQFLNSGDFILQTSGFFRPASWCRSWGIWDVNWGKSWIFVAAICRHLKDTAATPKSFYFTRKAEWKHTPYHPCMVFFTCLRSIFMVNVGKYTYHIWILWALSRKKHSLLYLFTTVPSTFWPLVVQVQHDPAHGRWFKMAKHLNIPQISSLVGPWFPTPLKANRQNGVHLPKIFELPPPSSRTPRKINMEPKNHPIVKENHLPNHHFQVPC